MQYKWTALTVTTVGLLMAGIDIRILIIGMPTVAHQLHAGAAELIWVTQSFQLAATVSLLVAGRISDIFGRVKLYNMGFVVFTLGSVLSALSSNVYQLFAFLTVQGVGTAILLANSSAIITDASPRNELGTLLGISQTAFRVGAMMGLTLSGLILTFVDWRGLFYVNIPIGIFGAYWGRRQLREISIRDPEKKIDWSGFAAFASGLTLVLLAVTYLSYGLSAVWIGAGLLLGGFVLLSIFVRIELRTASPLVDFDLFKIRVFTMGNIAQCLYSFSWAGLLVLLAFYLQIGLGYTPFEAGIAVVPIEIAFLFSSVLSGKLSDKYGSRTLSTLGLVISSLAMFALSRFGTQSQYLQIALVLIVIGVGSGMFVTPNSRAIMGSVPQNRRGIASGIYATVFNIGFTASYGLAILFLTLGIPYASLSLLLQGSVLQTQVSAIHAEFLNGFRIGIFLFALINTAGIIPSISRGSKEIRVV
ncbi:MAG: MFS transporter [Nitrososphaerales archaeon]